jgi:crotonobetainyl-CoA:carnitine CoA-transferase CaiB-like acyl-CoA transferase
VATRVLGVLDVAGDERFATFAARMRHRDELEALMVDWCAARPAAEVMRILGEAHAAVGPVMDMADIATDVHFRHREAVVEVGDTPMQALIARLSATPGRLSWPGPPLDAFGDEIRERGWGDGDTATAN